MPKSVHRPENQILLELLRRKRVEAGITQAELSGKLGRAQSFISDVERGHRRLDLVQLRDLTRAMGIELVSLVREFDTQAGSVPRRAKR